MKLRVWTDYNFFNFQRYTSLLGLRRLRLHLSFIPACLLLSEKRKRKKKTKKEKKRKRKYRWNALRILPRRVAVGEQITGWSSRYEIRLLRFGVRVASVSSSGRSFQRIGLSGRAVVFLVQASRSTGRRICNTDGIFKRVAHPSREKVCAPRRNRGTKDRQERRRETRLSRSRGVEKGEERGRREKRYEVETSRAHTVRAHRVCTQHELVRVGIE